MVITAHEADQNPAVVAALVEMYQECPGDVDPIAVVDSGHLIDGHHRLAAATQLGVTPRLSVLPSTTYAALLAAGFDGMEIAAITHLLAGNDDAAYHLDAQFPGAGIIDRALAYTDR